MFIDLKVEPSPFEYHDAHNAERLSCTLSTRTKNEIISTSGSRLPNMRFRKHVCLACSIVPMSVRDHFPRTKRPNQEMKSSYVISIVYLMFTGSGRLQLIISAAHIARLLSVHGSRLKLANNNSSYGRYPGRQDGQKSKP